MAKITNFEALSDYEIEVSHSIYGSAWLLFSKLFAMQIAECEDHSGRPKLYGIRKFITVFTRAHHRTQFWHREIQPTSSQNIRLKTNFNIPQSTPTTSKWPLPFKLYCQDLIRIQTISQRLLLEVFMPLFHTKPHPAVSVSFQNLLRQPTTVYTCKFNDDTKMQHEKHFRCSPHSCNYSYRVLAALNWPLLTFAQDVSVSPRTQEHMTSPQDASQCDALLRSEESLKGTEVSSVSLVVVYDNGSQLSDSRSNQEVAAKCHTS